MLRTQIVTAFGIYGSRVDNYEGEIIAKYKAQNKKRSSLKKLFCLPLKL